MNGDQDYEDIYSVDYHPEDDIEYWRMVSPTEGESLKSFAYYLFCLIIY